MLPFPPQVIAADGQEAAYEGCEGIEDFGEPTAPGAHVERLEEHGAVWFLSVWATLHLMTILLAFSRLAHLLACMLVPSLHLGCRLPVAAFLHHHLLAYRLLPQQFRQSLVVPPEREYGPGDGHHKQEHEGIDAQCDMGIVHKAAEAFARAHRKAVFEHLFLFHILSKERHCLIPA